MLKNSQKKVKITPFVLDVFFIAYTLIIIDRIILNTLIADERFFGFSWTRLFFICLVGGLIGFLWTLTKNSPGCKLYGLVPDESSKVLHYIRVIFMWGIVVLTFVAGYIITKFSFFDLFDLDGLTGAGRIFSAILHPNFSIFDKAIFAIIETVYIAMMATGIALLPAFLLGFLGARNLMSHSRITLLLYFIVRLFMNSCRSIEPIIWAVIFSVWVGIGPFAGMLALMIHSIAALGKLYSEQVENIDEGLIEAIKATGASPIQIVLFGVVPQVILPFMAFTIYRWDINVRMATVIGLVGGGGVGTLLMQYQGLAKWNEVGLIIIMISIVVWVMDYCSAKIRAAIY